MFTACSKKGDPGAPGNQVNVSRTIQLTNTDYVNGYWGINIGVGGSQAQSARVATIIVDSITAKIVESGTVLVYLKSINGIDGIPNQYTLLPFSIPSFATGYLTRIQFAFEAGKIRIYYLYETTDAASATPNVFIATVPTFTFRYVIIPGSAGFRSTIPPVDYNDYEAVVKYYHLD
jgi:hypothetical protein